MDSLLLVRLMLRIIGANFPLRIGFGIIFALVTDNIKNVSMSFLNIDSKIFAALNAVSIPGLMAIGVGIAFIWSFLRGQRTIPEDVKIYFEIIEECATRGKFSETQKYQYYHTFLNNLSDRMKPTLKLDTKAAIAQTEARLTTERS